MSEMIRKTTYLVSGCTIIASVVIQIYSLAANNDLELVNFLSLFTIQSNILAGIVFILAGQKQNHIIDKLRGVATLSLVVTSLGFIILLDGTQDYLLSQVNLIVHYFAPFFALISWLFHPPTTKFTFIQSLTWLLYPFLYFIYTMIRGYLTGWYPYDFIDPNKVSIGEIAYNFGIILLGSLTLIWSLTRHSRFSQPKPRSNP